MIYTDHKPLTFALSSKTDKHSPCTFRHLDYISQFTSDIRLIPGTENVPADALTRLPVSVILTPSSIDLTAVAQDQPSLGSLDLTSCDTMSWIYAHICIHTCVCAPTHVCMCVCIYIRPRTCVCTHTHTYTHIYTHIYMCDKMS